MYTYYCTGIAVMVHIYARISRIKYCDRLAAILRNCRHFEFDSINANQIRKINIIYYPH